MRIQLESLVYVSATENSWKKISYGSKITQNLKIDQCVKKNMFSPVVTWILSYKHLTWDQLSLISSLSGLALVGVVLDLFNLTEFSMLICWQLQAKECMLCLNSAFYWALWWMGTNLHDELAEWNILINIPKAEFER